MGIDGSRLTTKGFGDSKPIDSNEFPEGRANDRRVEFVKMQCLFLAGDRKTVHVTIMKAIILVTGYCLLVSTTNAQTFAGNKTSTLDSTVVLNDNYFKTHFLWFTGHWNDKKNVFTTTSHVDTELDSVTATGGAGITINVSPQGTVTINSKNVDEWNKKIENGLAILRKTEDELKSPSGDAKEWGHHFNEVTLPVLYDIKEEWKQYKIDSKEVLVENENQNNLQEQQAENKFISSMTSWCQNLKPEHDKILAFYRTHKHDKESDLSYPPPPAYSNKCISCDTSLEKLYHIQDSVYTEKFFKPESDMIRTCLGILRNLSLIGRREGSSTWAEPGMEDKVENAFHFSKDLSKAGPFTILILTI